jgi:magnesium transporter
MVPMLGAYPAKRPDDTSLKTATWVDLFDPTDAERSAFEEAFGLRVPTKEQLVEIESTSRLRTDGDALYMTAPLLFAADNEPWVFAPTGFVLAKNVLLTVRSSKLTAFHTVITELTASEHIEPAHAFVRLLEVLVDRMADLLEGSARDLDDASHLIFRPEAAPADDPHRPHQRAHGARSIYARVPRSDGEIRGRTLPRMDRARCE